MGGLTACFIEPDGPEPFVYSHRELVIFVVGSVGGGRDEEDDFAFYFAFREIGVEFGGRSVVEGLEGLGEFAGDTDGFIGCEFFEDGEGRGEAMR